MKPDGDLLVSGAWVVQDAKPFWVWKYSSGWEDWVSVVEVAIESSTAVDKAAGMEDARGKVDAVYRSLNLPPMDMQALWQQLSSMWELRSR